MITPTARSDITHWKPARRRSPSTRRSLGALGASARGRGDEAGCPPRRGFVEATPVPTDGRDGPVPDCRPKIPAAGYMYRSSGVTFPETDKRSLTTSRLASGVRRGDRPNRCRGAFLPRSETLTRGLNRFWLDAYLSAGHDPGHEGDEPPFGHAPRRPRSTFRSPSNCHDKHLSGVGGVVSPRVDARDRNGPPDNTRKHQQRGSLRNPKLDRPAASGPVRFLARIRSPRCSSSASPE